MKLMRGARATALLMILWAGVVGYGVLAGWWHRQINPSADAKGFMVAAQRLISNEPHADLALALISNGRLVDEHFASLDDTVNRQTVFPVASMSKWITAVGVMELVRKGSIDLDVPVSRYLKRWTLPASQFDLNGVTTRRLLSHTAGLTDGLGFGDYRLEERLPTLEESLRAPRASTGQPTAIVVGYQPGSRWQYSGAGYLIMQLLVEEATGRPFGDFMRKSVLEPLGMSCSSFDNMPSPQSARPYDISGRAARRFQYAAAAATGFSTCVSDMVRWVQAHLEAGSPQLLDAELRRLMREPHGRKFGFEIWGLGTMLYAPTRKGAFVFGHDGNNDPAINAAVRINPDNGDGIIVLTSGGRLMAGRLAAEWTYWQTGGPDFLIVGTAVREAAIPLAVGWLLALAGATIYLRSTVGKSESAQQSAPN